MIVFEFDREYPDNLTQIIDNYSLARAGNYDVCILGSVRKRIKRKNIIHLWIRTTDYDNSNLMILLSYIILGHPEWKRGTIKIFDVCKAEDRLETKEKLLNLI